MRFFSILILCCVLATLVQAQYGIHTISTLPKQRIAEVSTGNKLFPILYGVGADYWFRLKKYRLEFLPAFHVQYGHESVTLSDATKGSLNWKVLDFSPMIQFYPLDFKNDCMCPTFSKQGQLFKKGWFVKFGPGIGFSDLQGKGTQVNSVSEFFVMAKVGTGLDVGISDLLTLSPAINYQIAQNLDWSEFFSSSSSSSVNVLSGLFINLRLGWRFDKKNY